MSGALSKSDAQDRLAAIGLAPRGLPLDLAAAYVGLSPALFEAEVAAGRYPKPTRHGGSDRKAARKVWDVKALDDAMDALSGRVAPSAATQRASAREIRERMMAEIEDDA